MTRYLVFTTMTAALDADAKISQRARKIFADQGYELIGTAVAAKTAETGETDPDVLTVRWAVPRKRLDGKWVIPHNEIHSAANFAIDVNGTTVCQYCMQ